jgi:hypothetical protein
MFVVCRLLCCVFGGHSSSSQTFENRKLSIFSNVLWWETLISMIEQFLFELWLWRAYVFMSVAWQFFGNATNKNSTVPFAHISVIVKQSSVISMEYNN